MRRLPLLALFLFLLLGLVAFGFHRFGRHGHWPHYLSSEAAEVLRNAKTATLYSVDPSYVPANVEGEKLQYWKVLGKMILDEKQTASAAGAFQSAIAGWDGKMGMCFNPRHALRIESGGHEYDFLLCYQCRQLEVYRDGKKTDGIGVTGSPDVLNKMLAGAKIPLAPSNE